MSDKWHRIAGIDELPEGTMRAFVIEGREVVEEAEELRAVCFQHELDHLDGVLFIDRISRLKRSLYVSKRKKALRLEEPQGVR